MPPYVAVPWDVSCYQHNHINVTGELEDHMESFFLSETSKYLFLLQANATALPDNYIFTTEGHLLPPFPAVPPRAVAPQLDQQAACRQQIASPWRCFLPDFSSMWLPPPEHDDFGDGQCMQDKPADNFASNTWAAAEEKCVSLCSSMADADMTNRQRHLQAALPLLPLAAQDAVILR